MPVSVGGEGVQGAVGEDARAVGGEDARGVGGEGVHVDGQGRLSAVTAENLAQRVLQALEPPVDPAAVAAGARVGGHGARAGAPGW